jgi:hypothetical protein
MKRRRPAEPWVCDTCGHRAQVKLNGRAFCLTHFDGELVALVARLRQAAEPEPFSLTWAGSDGSPC